MQTKTKAIVLSKIRFKDNDLIIKCYTSNHGIVSYLLKGVLKSKKNNKKTAYFQPLSLLELETDYKDNRSLQFIKDLKTSFLYGSFHSNIVKSAIAMFLAEILSQALKEEEQNLPLYDYLEASFIWLDTNSEISNAHLLFLLELTKYLGFYPDNSNTDAGFFNLLEGQFQYINNSKYCIYGEDLTLLKQFLGTNFDALNEIKINSKQRQQFLKMLLQYFDLHLTNFNQPKSLQILNDVFN